MASELEGLIAGLLVRVSCAGEQGCSVTDVLDAIQHLYGKSRHSQEASANDIELIGEGAALHDRTASTIWQWLAARKDVFVGRNGEYNHLSLDDVLALPPPEDASSGDEQQEDPAAPASMSHHVKVYASEETMWESLTGHAVDYKRVPRSEWILLLGIASKTSEGILQGDLGRLVDQDKRSVPKRTDALLRKGYIAKRTTLVRGTKTSKMWLKLFAPPLPKDGENTVDEPRADMNITRQVLVANLDPVPWHIRWTGESIDYTALATTILAVVKEWEVLRLQDLKSKLGVLGMRWQMKVLAKVCRFLNARGVIQYVAAKLGDKVFKDCVKFGRDLNAEDWSLYLATGKRHAKKANKTVEAGLGDGDDAIDPFLSTSTNVSEVSSAPPWSIDKPLPATIVELTSRFGDAGIANPDVYGLTLGPAFSRYLSSMTGAISTANLQPPGLQHLQLRSEHTRTGKVASYRYFAQHPMSAIDTTTHNEQTTEVSPRQELEDASLKYGFDPVSGSKLNVMASATLADLCGAGKSRRKRKAPPKKIKTPEVARDKQEVQVAEAEEVELEPKEAEQNGRPKQRPEIPETKPLRITLKVPPGKLRGLISEGDNLTSQIESPRPRRTRRSTLQVPDVDTTDLPAALDEGIEAPEKTTTGRKRRGHGGRVADINSSSRPWKCEKCGGSWKNDIGLKYHLEKSRTSCNPTFDEFAPAPERRRKRASPEQTIEAVESSSSSTPSPAENVPESGAVNNTKERDLEDQDTPAPTPSRSVAKKRPRAKKALPSRSPINLTGGSLSATPDWHRPPITSFDTSRATTFLENKYGPLVESEHSQPRPILALSERSSQSVVIANHRHTHEDMQREPAFQEPSKAGSPNMPELNSAEALPPQEIKIGDKGNQGRPLPTAYHLEIPSEAGHEPVREQLEGQAMEKNPYGQAIFGARLSRSMLNNRIIAIIIDLLAEQKGVFPGGKALWHAISIIWGEKYPTDAIPTAKAAQAGLREALSKKHVVEHWHAFRDDKGMFSKCQVIMQPILDPFSPEATALVDRIKEVFPQLYMPPPFTAPEDSITGKDYRRGRRNLASEVEVLSAPVYAAQTSQKRKAEEVDDDAPSRKRSKRKDKQKKSVPSPRRKRKRGEIRWITERSTDRIAPRGWPDASDAAMLEKPANGLQFLAPNTYLEEDPPTQTQETPASQQGEVLAEPPETKKPISPINFSSDAIFGDTRCVQGSSGSWPYLDAQHFESHDVGYTLRGWMPDTVWFRWAAIVQEIEKRTTALGGRKRRRRGERASHQGFVNSIVACMDLEESWAEAFIGAPRMAAGPHNIFIRLFGGLHNHVSVPSLISWPEDGQLTPRAMEYSGKDSWISSTTASGDEDDLFDWAEDPRIRDSPEPVVGVVKPATLPTVPAKPKRVTLTSRALMSLPSRKAMAKEAQAQATKTDTVDEPDKVLAAFVAVRVLLGGSDKSIDWGLLLRLFPNIELATLRRFWINARKQQGALISKTTKDFQDKFLAAYEREELPEFDFEDPLEYDWDGLIEWTLRLNETDIVRLPRTRELLDDAFASKDAPHGDEDWQEKFFHPQASVFSRFEWATAGAAAVPLGKIHDENGQPMPITDLEIARSWVRSLCCTNETDYSIQEIKDKLSTLAAGDSHRNNMLLAQAIEDLTQQRVITKMRKTFSGGRPYRLNEYFTYMISKLSHQAKYQDAATFKTKLDAVFRRGGTMKLPYTLDDGSVMALTNLNAAGRVRLVPVNVPYIPLGFEPGNYESRKFPKSYYHFAIEAEPTDTYLYSEDIEVLQLADEEGPPVGSVQGEIPQWFDFFGKRNVQRWMEVLGAFCFVYATRGFVTVQGICTALKPILEEYEAHIIIDWGKRTGVLKDHEGGLGTTVGEWWWLAVPWLSRSGQTGRVRSIRE